MRWATFCQELAKESKSLLMLNKRNDYIFAMRTVSTLCVAAFMTLFATASIVGLQRGR